MRNHRNVKKEFDSIIAAYAYINYDWDRDLNVVDITTFDNAKKAKCNRLVSIIGWIAKHVPEFKIILACASWVVPHVSFRYIVEDLENIFNYMRQHSGVCYIVKVNYIEDLKTAIRLIPVSKKDYDTIHNAIEKFFKKEYEIGRRCHEKYYWQ